MALIPEIFLDCVAAIGKDDAEGKRQWIASGFLYGHQFTKPDNSKHYRVYLVTNRHVFEGLTSAYVRFNPKADEPARDYPISLNDGKIRWMAHPNEDVDVAVLPINIKLLREHAMQIGYFKNTEHVADISSLRDMGVMEGDFVYVLGFPMGLVGERRNAVIVRNGSIARMRDLLSRSNIEFLVDSSVFPGNSGGPVVCRPEPFAIPGTKAQVKPLLIGIVKQYVAYEDVAVSLQTKRPRVVFEENSGLAAVHPVDCIEEAIAAYQKREEIT